MDGVFCAGLCDQIPQENVILQKNTARKQKMKLKE